MVLTTCFGTGVQFSVSHGLAAWTYVPSF